MVDILLEDDSSAVSYRSYGAFVVRLNVSQIGFLIGVRQFARTLSMDIEFKRAYIFFINDLLFFNSET
jgi:hypothetical protein